MSIRRALISVSDKKGLVELGQFLVDQGIEIVSTGGTARNLKSAGISVKSVDQLTGFPEMMDGRLKTLHPKVHGGILNRRDNPDDREAMGLQGIVNIDLVVVNLYPFVNTVRDPDVLWADAIENIDIGGPAMVRSAAKNHRYVTVVVDPEDYPLLIEQIRDKGEVETKLRREFALKAFRHTASYDTAIAQWMGEELKQGVLTFPAELSISGRLKQELRYGENPHQKAALYEFPLSKGPSILKAKQLQGKELSYNNINDANAALAMIMDFTAKPAAIAVKHANPCGAAYADTLERAFELCRDADPVSIFGGIVALNREVDEDTAEQLAEIFLEVIIAPSFSQEALEILEDKQNLRLLALPAIRRQKAKDGFEIKTIDGGFLIQSVDALEVKKDEWEHVAGPRPRDKELMDAEFAWTLVKHVKSNAIVVVKDGVSLGIGAGQMNRVEATRIALEQAGYKARRAVLASDAFFPFADSIEEADDAGISLIVQPKGALKQDEVVEAADDANITMLLTNQRHFKH